MSEKEKSIRNAGWISLGETESVENWSHPSIFLYLPGIIVGVTIFLVGVFIPLMFNISLTLSAAVILATLIFGFLISLVQYIRYITVFYVFTDSRIIKKVGILDHSVTKVSYDSIEDLSKELPIEGRILGYGHLSVTTATPEQDDISMRFLPKINIATEVIGDYRALVSDRKKGEFN